MQPACLCLRLSTLGISDYVEECLFVTDCISCCILFQPLDPSEFMYAVGQGAMAVECRANDEKLLSFLTEIHDYDTILPCIAERAFLQTLVSLPVYLSVLFKYFYAVLWIFCI